MFADYGVDSLLSLTVTGRYREELDIDLESSVFIDQPTVKDFKQFLAPMSQGEVSDGSTSDPESSSSFNGGSSTDESSAGSPVSSPPNEKVTQVEQHATIKEIRAILADEIGVSEEELKDDENLGEMGMDSLLSLTVLGRIRETLDLDLPGEFFIENQTLNDVEDALGLKPKPAPAPAPAPVPAPVSAPILKEPVPNANSTIMTRASPHPRSTSILLQGNRKPPPRPCSCSLMVLAPQHRTQPFPECLQTCVSTG